MQQTMGGIKQRPRKEHLTVREVLQALGEVHTAKGV